MIIPEITAEYIMVAIFAFSNMILNIAMIVYLWKINKGIARTLDHHIDFADAMCKIDSVATENAVAIDERISESITDVNKRIDFLTRWQKVTAKMIKDDLDRLKQHDDRVGDISNVIERIRARVEPEENKG